MIVLPYPANALWPNKRPHWSAKAKAVRTYRHWAKMATLADNTRPPVVGRLIVTLCPKPRGPVPDADNISAAIKAAQDGVADAYKVDDRTFGQPRILIGERTALGGVSIVIEPPL